MTLPLCRQQHPIILPGICFINARVSTNQEKQGKESQQLSMDAILFSITKLYLKVKHMSVSNLTESDKN